jgi:hypothetical protein
MPKRNASRKHQAELDERERRLAILGKYRAERRKLTEYAEDMGITYRTAQRDAALYRERLLMAVDDLIEQEREAAKLRLQELEDDLEAALTAGTMGLKDRIELARGILKDRRELLGLDAPKKTVSQNTNLNLDAVDPTTLPEYRRWLYETRFMDAAAKEKAFQLIRESGLNVRQLEAVSVPKTSPLWNEQPKELEEK